VWIMERTGPIMEAGFHPRRNVESSAVLLMMTARQSVSEDKFYQWVVV
jgi:hypothetical protein